MAVTNNETQVTWAAANNLSIAAAGTGTSDAFTLDQTCVMATATCKVDNDGVAAAGDTVDFFLLGATYDPDGAGAVEYGTTVQDTWLCTLNTATTDPAIANIPINPALSGGKIYARNNSAARAQTVSVTILEKRM